MSDQEKAMSATLPAGWPAMSVPDAYEKLTAPGAPFEMEEALVRGVPMRVYKNAPPNLRAVFEAGRAWGARDCIVYEDERVSFEDHYRAVATFARVLASRYGVEKGDRVAIAMRNFPEWSVVFWATAILGGIIVPLNAWGTGAELEYGLTDSGAKVLVVDGERLERITPELPKLKLAGLIASRTPDEVLAAAPTAERFEDLVAGPGHYTTLDDSLPPVPDLHPDDEVTIFYTSGTTGKPKGALGTHRNILTNLISLGFSGARSVLRRGEELPAPDPNAPQRAMLLSVPLFHATGCHSILVPNYVHGGKLVFMHKWNPERALELIEKERINTFGGVPAMVWQVLESPDLDKRDTSSVEGIGYGGAPATSELVARIKQAFPKVQPSNGYGLTETSAATTQNAAEDYVNRPDSAGLAVPVVDLKVANDQGDVLPVGEIGELWIRGPNVVVGYWNKPEETAKTFEDGWLKSG